MKVKPVNDTAVLKAVNNASVNSFALAEAIDSDTEFWRVPTSLVSPATGYVKGSIVLNLKSVKHIPALRFLRFLFKLSLVEAKKLYELGEHLEIELDFQKANYVAYHARACNISYTLKPYRAEEDE